MRQLRFNYVFPVGYVQPYTALGPDQLQYPLLYGLSATQQATASEILAFTPMAVTSEPDTITFPVSNGEYLNILVPAQFGAVDHFVFNNLNVRWPQVNTTVADNGLITAAFIVVDGVNYAYNWYVSQYPQHGTNLSVTIPKS